MKNQTLNTPIFEITIQLIFLLGIIVWCLLILAPFASIVLWSLILALAFSPLHTKLTNKLKGSPKLASLIIISGIFIIIVLPAGYMVSELIDEIKVLSLKYNNGDLKIPPPTDNVKQWPLIGENIFTLWQNAHVNLEQLILKFKNEILSVGSYIGNGILGATRGILQILISLVIAGVLLSKGGINEYMLKFFRKIGGKIGDEIADVTERTVRSVVKGVIGEAMVLALLNGIVFLLAGVPFAGIWTMIVFVLAVLQLPVFIVTVPVMIYFFSVKEFIPAVIWTISLLAVSISDNFLTPLMLGKNAPVPMLVIFLGVIGGCVLSGFIGLFTGAIVMSVGYTLLVKWVNSNEPLTK
ncbi:MAG TPA: AI-2E family transporter [Ignavibacteria bacterium]|mgnify:CR=1 FL=1|nr:AI-2E family transporter [Ignavibacteria bacterium]HMR38965.1 AI-2E family transporter [Ignavibacteria bacterium]